MSAPQTPRHPSLSSETRPFDWSARRIETSHTPPRKAIVLPGKGPRGQRRVAAFGDYEYSCWLNNKQWDGATTWLYSEDGTLDGDTTGEWKLQALS